MKKNEGLVMNVGTASIILVLLVFILSMFGVLSIKASNHELRLAEKLGASVKEYYDADALGQRVLAKIDFIVKSEANSSTGDTFVANIEKEMEEVRAFFGSDRLLSLEVETKNSELKKISYAVIIRENARIMVELAFHENAQYTIEHWSVRQDALGEYELDGLDGFDDMDSIDDNEGAEGDTQQLPEGEELWDGIIDPTLVD